MMNFLFDGLSVNGLSGVVNDSELAPMHLEERRNE
jgi:hypothetical protein